MALTPAGRTIVTHAFPAHAERVREPFGVLDETEKRQLAEICRKLDRAAARRQRPRRGLSRVRVMTDPARALRDSDDRRLLDGVRAGDESAFMALVERYSGQLLRVAQMYVSTRAVAEEVVQETWIGVLRGAERFEGRSTVKTWLFRILANIARTRARKEARSIPFSSAAGPRTLTSHCWIRAGFSPPRTPSRTRGRLRRSRGRRRRTASSAARPGNCS